MQATDRKIPFHRVEYGVEEGVAIQQALAADQLNEGTFVKQFEQEFAKYVHARHCLLVPSGALALYLGLLGLNETRSFKVPSNYGIFAANALMMHGLEVNVVDVAMDGCMHDTAGPTLPVHANGRYADVNGIEDSAQDPSRHSKGEISCYSFHPSKLITLGGIGGAVCCDDDQVFEKMVAVKDHGRPERAHGKKVPDIHKGWGTNLKVSDLNAAFGLEQLKKLPERLAIVKHTYRLYKDLLGDKVEWLSGSWPAWRIDCLVQEPQQLVESLAQKGIQAQRFYTPLHRQPVFLQPRHKFPVAEYLYTHGIYLPTCSTDDEVEYVCQQMKSLL